MELKFITNKKITQDQLLEIAYGVMNEPDMGWANGIGSRERGHQSYTVEHQGEHGKYEYRVNLSTDTISILKIT